MIQLKLRTEYSFGQSYAPVGRMVEWLKEKGCTAAGIVDVNSTWGHIPFYEECKKAGITPLLGIEIAVNDDDVNTTMWFLAKNTAGLSEIYREVSRAHTQRIKMRSGSIPRLYRADVEAFSENIVKFAGTVTDGEWLAKVGAVVDLSPGSRVLNAAKRSLAEKYGLRIVDTSDNAYIVPEDARLFEIVAKGATKPTPQFILPDLNSALSERSITASLIAAECAGLVLPHAPMIRAEGDLEALCREGAGRRKMEWNDVYEERLLYELGLIRSKDFTSYFLVVADMCRYAKEHMLVGPSRGSSAGSLVCYLTGITEIDPIPAGLFFERFIDVSRADLPDIDLDFPDDKREMVFEYMAGKYGVENTAHIGTVSRYHPKSALIEVCKALGIPPSATGEVKTAMITRNLAERRATSCLEDTLKDTEAGRKFARNYPEATIAAKLEGHASHTGVHAAGLLVCNAPLTDFCVVDDKGIAHIEKGPAETLGLLKIDVLGLRTLSVLADAGVEVDWYALKFDDPKVYDVFTKTRLCGIFQFEGNAMRSIAEQMGEFTSLSEVDAVTALARPGPFGGGVTQEYIARRDGKPYESIHPLVESTMSETFGLPIYQEQTMEIVRRIGQFDWEQTSFIRKAMSKRKGKEAFEPYWEKFRDGAARQDIPEDAARKTWETINAMGAWQMNKSHTHSYAVISYWTAYLKAHHPLEFAASTLRNAKDEDSALELLREMVREGIEFTPFDLETSRENWSAQEGRLVGGFLNLVGFGEKTAKTFVAARDAGKLTAAQLAKIKKAENIFSDIFPFHSKYTEYYETPWKKSVVGEVLDIADFDGTQVNSKVFLGEIVHKSPRNINEDVLIKKREGKIESGPQEFLDIKIRDDTGIISARFGRREYEKVGRAVAEGVKVGAHVMIRANFIRGIRFGFVTAYKVLKP